MKKIAIILIIILSALNLAGCNQNRASKPTASTLGASTNQTTLPASSAQTNIQTKIIVERIVPDDEGVGFITTRGLEASMIHDEGFINNLTFVFQLTNSEVNAEKIPLNVNIPVNTAWVRSVKINRLDKDNLTFIINLIKPAKGYMFGMADGFAFIFN